MLILGCNEGEYGPNCDHVCDCQYGSGCDAFTGACICRNGYMGPTCRQMCPEGFYGNNCTEKCDCLNGGMCGRKRGKCRCLPGYTGKQCEDGRDFYAFILKHEIILLIADEQGITFPSIPTVNSSANPCVLSFFNSVPIIKYNRVANVFCRERPIILF